MRNRTLIRPEFHAEGWGLCVANVVAFPVKSRQRQLILIVNDDLTLRTVLSEHLRERGFDTVVVTAACDAIKMLKLGIPVGLVFFDLRSEIEGYGIAHWMSVNSPEVPLILAHEHLGEMAVAARLAGAEICSKPYNADAAAKKIRTFLNCVRSYDNR
jgi:DNA-binding NtrC family response regulator